MTSLAVSPKVVRLKTASHRIAATRLQRESSGRERDMRAKRDEVRARGSSGNGRLWQRLCRALAAVVASGSQAERRERKGSDFCVGNDCGKGPLARVGHLGERDAAPTGLEFLGRGAYVPLFLSPNPHFMLDATVDLEPISSSA